MQFISLSGKIKPSLLKISKKNPIIKTEILSYSKVTNTFVQTTVLQPDKEILYHFPPEDSVNNFLFGKDTVIQAKHHCFQQLWQ